VGGASFDDARLPRFDILDPAAIGTAQAEITRRNLWLGERNEFKKSERDGLKSRNADDVAS
jgi:hypothetical protein